MFNLATASYEAPIANPWTTSEIFSGGAFAPWLVEAECYADCDQNGTLDFFDFLCFQNEFTAGTTYADCDGSGTLDFFDFLCFQNEFTAGCP